MDGIMKRDGRKFDHQTLEEIRLMAIERVRDGERASEVIDAYGFNRTTIYKWIQASLRPGIGVKALRSRPAKNCSSWPVPLPRARLITWIVIGATRVLTRFTIRCAGSRT